MKKFLISAALIALAGSALAQDAMTVVKPETLTWKEHPIFKGAQTAILLGDPTKAEVVVQRVKFPPNYRVAPHTHPYSEIVTVITGNFGSGMGETFDAAKGEMLTVPGCVMTPARPLNARPEAPTPVTLNLSVASRLSPASVTPPRATLKHWIMVSPCGRSVFGLVAPVWHVHFFASTSEAISASASGASPWSHDLS